jgi:Cu-processing system ATP-binding protein
MITFRNVVKRFGTHVAVDGLSMAIGRGEVVALLGPNGSGKTTTVKLAAGLIRPDSGEVTAGDPPRPPWNPDVRRALSFLPQRVSFPEALTGREVVDFYSRLRDLPPDRGDIVLKFAALNGAGSRSVSTYSGGMLQRLGLAVAMLPDTEVLLLDEPTAALDPEGLCAFYGLIERRRADGRTVLFTSHQVGDVERLADRFLVLVRGRLAAEMTQSSLRDRLAARGVIRVRLDRRPPLLLAAIRRWSPSAVWIGDEIVAPGPAAIRPVVLDEVRASGATICGLVAEDGRLDSLYRELVAEVEGDRTEAVR